MINRSMDAPKWIGNLSSILIIWIIWKDKFHDEKSQSFFTAQKSIRSVCIIEILNTSRSKDTCNINVIETKRNSYFQTKKLFHLHIVFALKTFRFWERKKQHVQTCIVMKSVSWTICSPITKAFWNDSWRNLNGICFLKIRKEEASNME